MRMKILFRHFWFDLLLTFGAIFAILIGKGFVAAGLVIIVLIIEIAFSFDNAVINAKILSRLSRFWQTLFLTVGILIAVVGMRLVFPILLVALTANLAWTDVIHIALNEPETYAPFGRHHLSCFIGKFCSFCLISPHPFLILCLPTPY